MTSKKQKKFPVFLIFLLFFAGAAGWGLAKISTSHGTDSAGNTAGEEHKISKIKYYQCSMDPQITSNKPDKCTICGMTLAPVYDGEDGTAVPALGDTKGVIKLAASTAEVIGIATAPVMSAPVHKTLRVAGTIVDDETKHRILSARVPGRIEKLYVNQVGIDVSERQPLAVFYSPDVLTAQRLYLEKIRASEQKAGAFSISEIAESREKLLAYGLVDEDIQKLEKTLKPDTMFSLRAPFDGTVISRKVYEGQYVDVNDGLFEIGDFTVLWFVFDAYESDLPMLRLGQSVDVTLTSLPNEKVTAPITFIDPNLNATARTARVRVELPNPQRRILNNQTAEGFVHIETPSVLTIPRSALLYTRQKPVVYVDLGGGNYQLREVQLGTIGDDVAEIQSGVQEYEKVVVQAALLIDSQSQLMQLANQQPVGADAAGNAPTDSRSTNAADIIAHLTETQLPKEFVDAVLKITAALSSDDLAAYQQEIPAVKNNVDKLSEEIQNILKPLSEKLVTGKTLKEVRQPFEVFSNMVADIVRQQPQDKRQAFIFQCPMSPVLGTARWIQPKNEATLNPFFGSEMLNCGVELK